jgi:succinyl-CoA synthetase beta subunit
VVAAAKKMDVGGEVVIKSQILAGGRGLGTFTNGFKGGVHVIKVGEAEHYANKMLGQTLVTKQSGPGGKPVNVLFVAKKMQIKREMYFAMLLDRASAGPVVIACSEGGTSIEDLAAKYPDKIIKMPVDIKKGITDAQAQQLAKGLGLTLHLDDAAKQLQALFTMMLKSDCTMVEVNPLAEGPDGRLIAADAKLNFDDNAAFRQAETLHIARCMLHVFALGCFSAAYCRRRFLR